MKIVLLKNDKIQLIEIWALIASTSNAKSVIHQLSAIAHQFGEENAINWAHDFYRFQRPCSSIERKYFWQLPVEVPLFTLR